MKYFDLENIENQGGIVLRYFNGCVPNWFFRKICMAKNISYESVKAFRISNSDTWAVILKPLENHKPFTDEAILPKNKSISIK
jgi:hypothetical protein